ncbi:hypothetical protein I3842_07G019000 [Carya illinoinensis]|uniref:Phorbol-ester/DAG-type domain-containing protein n=1 Tax=Carya illinoinensis TaxID=32201 RepID=A0A922EF87_CARIL|nr:hypothetical protein I3842_07G019000 [Carya illinoinensis]KAG6702133.1 hypothetical protein I3842_07G019000 [Carya illinoinensis]KAG6702134.1 hypothetical protein I3842_07G019000 [Carya illinoinensis]
MENQHFSHHHPLTLVLINQSGYRCGICYERLATGSDYYGCKVCNFYIHKSCAEYSHELQHPSHPKHLLLLQLHRLDLCTNCSSGMFDFKYKCPHCHEFYLCPKCAFLPLTKKAENHDHPLNLMQKLLSFTCDHCLKKGNSMPYFCPTCLFIVHSECTSLPLTIRPSTIQAAIHDHPLTLMPSFLMSLTCNACGNEIKGRTFYFCATCSFVAHLDCAPLPSIVKVKRHKHPLNLIYSLPADQSKCRVCRLCAKMVDTNYGVYYCSSQDFVAHLHCATCKEERDETFVPNSKEDHHDKSIDSLPYIVKKTKPEGDRIEVHTEIKHFSHEHDLKLNDELGINQKCDACIRSISRPPFYTCAPCGFCLHKSCAELSRKLRHPLHQHPLKLLLREQKPFRCDACWQPCNGFDYRCDKCYFELDVQCSLIPDILTHTSHKHQLILASSSENKKCSSCGLYGRYNFSCVDCEFTLDFKCLAQPHTMNCNKHDHPFTLCYTSEDDSSEYYCDICEDKRDPKYWFYYCADCNYPAHLECILGKYPNLKFGKTFKYDIHQHPLALVQKTFAQCSQCGNVSVEDLAYECAECNFIIHRRCI